MKLHVILRLMGIFVLLAVPLRAMADGAESPQISQAIAQVVIDHPSLEPFLHPEVPGRVPLVTSDHLLEPGVSLSKFGQPVLIKPDTTLSTGPFLRFEGISMLSDVSVVRIRYPVEGVEGRFILTRRLGKFWEVRVSDVWER